MSIFSNQANQQNLRTITQNTYKTNKTQNNIQNENIKIQLLKLRKYTKAQINIKDILTNRLLFEQSQLDETIFKSDLVIQMKIPQQKYIKRNQKMQLGSIVRKFPKMLQNSYEASYIQLYNDMLRRGDEVIKQNNNDQQLLIRHFESFDKIQIQNKQKQERQNIFKYQINLQQNQQNKANLDNNKYKNRKVRLQSDEQQQITLNCQQYYTGILDAFIISYNTLVYTLQKLCGFKVRSFLISDNEEQQIGLSININIFNKQQIFKRDVKKFNRKIFIMLYLPDDYLIKAGNKYKIKKQIDYTQIDPFINDPMDSANRPLKHNKYAKNYLIDQQFVNNAQNNQQNDIRVSASSKSIRNAKMVNKTINEPKQFRNRKTVQRKLGFMVADTGKATTIINQAKLNKRQLRRFSNFSKQLDDRLQELVGRIRHQATQNKKQIEGHNCFNDAQDFDHITQQQKDYLYRINRFKYNLGVQKLFVQRKKQRKYFQILTELSHKYGYHVFDTPTLYSQFKLANKNKKFFSRLKNILVYKQNLAGPYGHLQLFNKMQRIKLSYYVLREYVRVQNFYMLNADIFALSDDYQKFGKIGNKKSSKFYYHYEQQNRKRDKICKGGLNGRSLEMDWHHFLVWRTDFATVRNYLGQYKAFQIFIKTCMIFMFLFLTPVGIFMQIIKKVIIQPKSSRTAYFPQFWFYMLYLLVATIIYGIFIEKYRRLQQNYIKNFVQQHPTIQFINQYRGPYMRDIINDNANTYNDKYMYWKDVVKTILIGLLFVLILGAQIGFYYGIRAAIVDFSYKIPQFDQTKFYLLRPIQLIGYSIFFIINALLYNYIIKPIAIYTTKYENRPTKQAYVKSSNLKLILFAIGIQLIGPIDLVFIQYTAKTSCSSDWCFKQLQAYVYCRYILILLFTLLNGIDMMRRFLKNKNIKLFQKKQQIQLTYPRKLVLFLQFVYKQSKKQQCADINFTDQTVALIQFATFLIVFPLGSAISFVSVLIDYNIQRMQILQNQQRPIPKSYNFQTYRKIIVAIGHWMLFFNFSQMFLTLQWLQYLFQNVVYAILPIPSPYSLMALKYAVILFFMILYQLIMYGVIKIAEMNHSVMDIRKWKMLQKFNIRTLNSGSGITLKLPNPIHSISRTFNMVGQKCQSQYQQSDQSEQQKQSKKIQDLKSQSETYMHMRGRDKEFRKQKIRDD